MREFGTFLPPLLGGLAIAASNGELADPAATAHICASPILDLPACRDPDLRCVWINRIDGRKPPADFEPDVELNDLSGVPDLLGAR